MVSNILPFLPMPPVAAVCNDLSGMGSSRVLTLAQPVPAAPAQINSLSPSEDRGATTLSQPISPICGLWRRMSGLRRPANKATRHPVRSGISPCKRKGGRDGPASCDPQARFAGCFAVAGGAMVFHGADKTPLWTMTNSGGVAGSQNQIEIAAYINESLGELEKMLGDKESLHRKVDAMAGYLLALDASKIGFELFEKIVIWYDELASFAQGLHRGEYVGQPQRVRLRFNRLRSAVPLIAGATMSLNPDDDDQLNRADMLREDRPPPIRRGVLPHVEGPGMEFEERVEPESPPGSEDIDMGDAFSEGPEDAPVGARQWGGVAVVAGAGFESARREMARAQTPPPETEPPRDYAQLDLRGNMEITAGNVWNEIHGKLGQIAGGQSLVVVIEQAEDRFRALADKLGKLIYNFGYDEVMSHRIYLYCLSLPGLYYCYWADTQKGNLDINVGVDMTWRKDINAEKDWKAILTGIDAIHKGNVLYVQLPGMIISAFNSIALQIKYLLKLRIAGLEGKYVAVQCHALGIEAVYLVTEENGRREVNFVARDIGGEG